MAVTELILRGWCSSVPCPSLKNTYQDWEQVSKYFMKSSGHHLALAGGGNVVKLILLLSAILIVFLFFCKCGFSSVFTGIEKLFLMWNFLSLFCFCLRWYNGVDWKMITILKGTTYVDIISKTQIGSGSCCPLSALNINFILRLTCWESENACFLQALFISIQQTVPIKCTMINSYLL